MYSRILPFILAIMVVACNSKDDVSPTGPVTQDQRPISDFTSIDVQDGFRVIIQLDTFDQVLVETNSNLQQYVKTYKNGSTLVAEWDNSVNSPSGTVVRVYITAQVLSSLKASGGTDMVCLDTITINNLRIELSGGSRYSGDIFVTNTFTSDLSGGSLLSLSGDVNKYNLTSSGGSIAEGFTLTSRELTCDVSGGGLVTMTVTKNLFVTASGGSSINYRGDGIVRSSNLSGARSLISYPRVRLYYSLIG